MERPDDLLADILERLPIGVFVLDPDGRVVLWNRHAERLTGWNRADLLGVPLLDAPVDVPSLTRIVDELRAGRPFTGRFPVRATSGPTLYLRAVPTTPPGAPVLGVLQDVVDAQAGDEAFALLDALWENSPIGLAVHPQHRATWRTAWERAVAAVPAEVFAHMGRLRSMLRALADDGALPSLVVSRLDRVATRLGVTRFTTLVHGHLVRAPTRGPENRAAADLLDLVSAHAHRSLGEFCDELVRGTSADTDDDIAVLAVRLT